MKTVEQIMEIVSDYASEIEDIASSESVYAHIGKSRYADRDKTLAELRTSIEELHREVAELKAKLAEAEKPEQVPRAWIFLQNNELLWPEDVENETPCEITGYVPLYTK